MIAEIWAEVLKLDKLGIDDNFFDLGGHSLKATQVISRVRQTFRMDLPLRVLFEAPTLAEFTSRVQTQCSGCGRT
jgi:acyl carrier protein